MSCFTATTNNNKYILPCSKVYCKRQTEIDLFPGYDSKCCCGPDKEFLFCKSNPVAVIVGDNDQEEVVEEKFGFKSKCCTRNK